MELEEAKISLENRWKNINQPLPDAIDKITCELFGDEQYKVLSLARQKEEEREKEALTRDLFK